MKWDELVKEATPLVAFLSKKEFFDQPYRDTIGAVVIHDATVGLNYATNDSNEEFTDWETVSNSEAAFPDAFDHEALIHRVIVRRLSQNHYFGWYTKNLNGADTKWTTPSSCVLEELMQRDIDILFSCYANRLFPPIWQDILTVYLNGGFPCGWSSHYPEGRLVVFSNH